MFSREVFFNAVSLPHPASRLPQELDDSLHLRSGEDFAIRLIALGYHGLPHAAREVHLLAEVAQGTVVLMVGVVHLCQLGEGVWLDFEFLFFHISYIFFV